MLCDLCQTREATRHETQCTSISGDIPKRRHLCQQCFEDSNPTQARELAESLKDGCRYCGAEPYIGGLHFAEWSGGVKNLNFKCKSCAEEYFGFLRSKMPDFGSETLTEEQAAELAKYDFAEIFAEAEEHMKKWSSERGSR